MANNTIRIRLLVQRRRQHGQQTDGDARRARLGVDPERHPRQDDDQERRHVDLDQIVADVARQLETDFQTRICTCRTLNS